MSVKRCQREVSSEEFSEWFAFAMLEPFGGQMEDMRAGMVAATIANCHSTKRRFHPSDFFSSLTAPRQEQSEADIRAVLDRVKRDINGR
jgi:hypothetical protein